MPPSPANPWLRAADLLDPPEPTDDLGRARRNPHIFIDKYCWVIPASGGAPIPFRLWDFQDQVLTDFQQQSNIVVLKARQLGLSWLSLAYALWLTQCNPGRTVLILNRNLGAAIELLDRIRFMRKHLPPELQQPIEQDTNDPKMPLLVFGNGSRVISLPSTEDTGSGLTGQLIIADEVAKWKWPVETFTAILPILSGGNTTLIAISTAKGTSNYFARLWHDAQPGAENPNGYWPIFIPSSAHPDRDEEWLEAEKRKYPDERRFKQEHPECLTADALVSTARGIVPICQVLAGDALQTGRVTVARPQPVAPTYRLTTTQGRTLRGTADHPIHVPGQGFVELADLTPDQPLTLVAPTFAEEYAVVDLPSLPGAIHTVTIDERWGRFLGYFAGDGSVHAGTISIVCDGKDDDVASDVATLLEQLISTPSARRIHNHGPNSSRRESQGSIELRTTCAAAVPVLQAIGVVSRYAASGHQRRHVCVPDVIWRSPQPVVREFLRGLFEADGSAAGRIARFGSSKLDFVRQVQLLLLGFGINASIHESHRRAAFNGQPMRRYSFWNMHLPMEASVRFFEEVGFVSARKSALVPQPKRAFRKRNEMVDYVAEVIEDEPAATYSLTIDRTHVFPANGILTHNTWQEAFQLADEAVFSEFDRSVHHRPFVRETQWPVWRGIDFGYHHAVCYWIEVQADRVAHIFSELHCRELTTGEFAAQIAERDRQLGLEPARVPAGVDPAGKARTSQSGTETDHITLKRAGLTDLRMIEPSVPSDRVDLVKTLLRDHRLFIDCHACPRLAEAMEQAQWESRRAPTGEKVRGESFAKDGLHEHFHDASGYGLANIWPPAGPPAGAPGVAPRPYRTRRYGNSDFA